MLTKTEKLMTIAITLILSAACLIMLYIGAKPGDYLSLGDPYWKNQYSAFFRAPIVEWLTILALVLTITLAVLLKYDKNKHSLPSLSQIPADNTVKAISHSNALSILLAAITTACGSLFIYAKLSSLGNQIIAVGLTLFIFITVLALSILFLKESDAADKIKGINPLMPFDYAHDKPASLGSKSNRTFTSLAILGNRNLLLGILFFLLASTFLLAIFMPTIKALQIIFGGFFVVFLPGFAASFALYEGDRINSQERILISFVLSIITVPLATYLLHLLGMKINAFNTALIIVSIIFLSLIAILIKFNKKNVGD